MCIILLHITATESFITS